MPFGLRNPEQEESPNFSSLLDSEDDDEIKSPIRRKLLSTLMEGPPKQEDYAPSLGRKIGAGLIGAFGGAKLGTDFVNKPYREATNRYNTEQLEPLIKGEQVERLGNTERRADINQKRLSMKDQFSHIKEQNTYMLNVLKEQRRHEKSIADIQNLTDDNEREARKAEETEKYHNAIMGHRNKLLGFMQSREKNLQGYRQQKLDRMGAGKPEKSVKAAEQKAIRDEAIQAVGADDRFKRFLQQNATGQWGFSHVKDKTGKVTEELDPKTAEMLKAAIARAESKVASKKVSDYGVAATALDPFNDLDQFGENDDDEDDE